jgi:hypothetical protein
MCTTRTFKLCEVCKLPGEYLAIVGMMLILIHEVLVSKEIL